MDHAPNSHRKARSGIRFRDSDATLLAQRGLFLAYTLNSTLYFVDDETSEVVLSETALSWVERAPKGPVLGYALTADDAVALAEGWEANEAVVTNPRFPVSTQPRLAGTGTHVGVWSKADDAFVDMPLLVIPGTGDGPGGAMHVIDVIFPDWHQLMATMQRISAHLGIPAESAGLQLEGLVEGTRRLRS
jgi:hypothetical protein